MGDGSLSNSRDREPFPVLLLPYGNSMDFYNDDYDLRYVVF